MRNPFLVIVRVGLPSAVRQSRSGCQAAMRCKLIVQVCRQACDTGARRLRHASYAVRRITLSVVCDRLHRVSSLSIDDDITSGCFAWAEDAGTMPCGAGPDPDF